MEQCAPMMNVVPAPPTSAIDLASDDLEEIDAWLPVPSPAVGDRLRAYGLLRPAHGALPASVLAGIEQLFATWHDLVDDDARRASLDRMFSGESHLRAVLLAIVPIYHDASFFDDGTPTESLVAIALVAHAKWRRWLRS